MKKIIKKNLSLLLASLLILTSVCISLIAFADDNIEINETNFPDKNFRNAIAFMYDSNGDGFLSKSERNTESMLVSGIVETYAFEHELDEDSIKINDLKGVEFFYNLKILRCSSVGTIESLDVSQLENLETLACNDLGLKSIDLSENIALINLSICSNDIEELDVRENINLKKLHCYSNDKLESINVYGLSSLEELRCDVCSIKSLDLTTNTNLSYLNCSYNCLTKLDLSNNTALVSNGNDITEYNIGHQKSSAEIIVKDGLIAVPMELEQASVVSSSLDYEDTVAYSNGYFYTSDADMLSGGIDYEYNTGISDSAFLSVHLDLTEKEHYYSMSAFDFDNNTALVECPICRDNYSLNFADSINAREGDDNFSEELDAVDDNIINAKDYAAILNTFE